MPFAALAVLIAIALGLRTAYPRRIERRAAQRRPLGPDGIVVGSHPLDLPERGGPAALLLHGAGDTPQVLLGLASYLHSRGFSVRVPLLAGHGRRLSEFSSVSATEWLDEVHREYFAMRAQHDRVAVVGLSMGGALAVTLAADHNEIPALVLLSPYLTMPLLMRQAAATSMFWGKAIPYFSSRGARSIRDPAAAAGGLGHGVFTPAALRALRDVATRGYAALAQVTSPTLVIQSREDNRISVSDAERAFRRLGASDKRLEWIDGAGHVITVDYGHEKVFASTASWLETHR